MSSHRWPTRGRHQQHNAGAKRQSDLLSVVHQSLPNCVGARTRCTFCTSVFVVTVFQCSNLSLAQSAFCHSCQNPPILITLPQASRLLFGKFCKTDNKCLKSRKDSGMEGRGLAKKHKCTRTVLTITAYTQLWLLSPAPCKSHSRVLLTRVSTEVSGHRVS